MAHDSGSQQLRNPLFKEIWRKSAALIQLSAKRSVKDQKDDSQSRRRGLSEE
jgi:hypothetical protein